ncbi:hypothetical protein Ae201684P_011408 [Aphanomyces euteiches]|nr:hypothetical protein Ae201684P_011408 [Aphanomyces euteiches]
MDKAVHLPSPTTSSTILCVTLYVCVGITALYRSVVPNLLPISRLKIFQYLVAAFCMIRSMSFVTSDLVAKDLVNRLALCVFFTVVLFQVFFWIDIVNPRMSTRSKRIWNLFVVVNLVFYLFLLVLQLVSPPPRPQLDADEHVRVGFWSDLLPVMLVALGSLASSIAMFYLSYKMRLRVQRIVHEEDTPLSQKTIATMYRALAFLNGVLLISSVLFAMRTIFYLQRPWSHKECGSIQDPDACMIVGYVLPEVVPCVLFLALLWEVDPRVWTTRLSSTETTPLLRKYPSTFETQNEMWQRPINSPLMLVKRPTTTSPQNKARWNPVGDGKMPQSATWLSFQCFQLKSPSDVHSSFIVVTTADGHDEIGRTEVVHTEDPVFHVMLKALSNASVCIRVYSIRNMNTIQDLSAQILVGETTVTVPSPGHAHLCRLPSKSGLLVVRGEANTVLDSSQHLTRAFVFREVPKMLVEEELVESPFTWEIPYQLLQLIVADLTEKLTHLKSTTASPPPLLPYVEDDSDGSSVSSSLLSNMIYQLQGNKRRRTNHKWRVEMTQLMENYQSQVHEALNLAGSDERHRTTFKPSTKKADPNLRFLALNLHAQMLTFGEAIPDDEAAKEAGRTDPTEMMRSDAPSFQRHRLYGTVTVGAFAAHVYGFGQGGIRQLRENWERLREQSQHVVGADLAVVQRDMHVLEWHIDQRLDVAFAQAVSALVTAFQQTLYVHFHSATLTRTPEMYLEHLKQHGFLFSVESLLSTVGSEAGMLGDMDAAVKALAHVTLQLRVVRSATYGVLISSRGPGGLTIELPLVATIDQDPKPAMMHRIPGQDKATGAVFAPLSLTLDLDTSIDIAVVPVLFNQGLNEVQTVANTVGRSQLQEEINLESGDVLEAYLKRVAPPSDVLAVWEMAKSKIQAAKAEKVMDILAMTSWIARMVGGGRVTCCKSAKDRTAMSVTLEEAQWMADDDRENQATWTQLLRTYGVRRENARKNIGTAQYAFNRWQNYMLPPDYKCPPGTGGGGKS